MGRVSRTAAPRIAAGGPSRSAAAAVAVGLVLAWLSVAASPSSAVDGAGDETVDIGLEASAPRVESVSVAGSTWHRVTADGFEASDRPGYPALPVHRVLVGIPAVGKTHLDITVSTTHTVGTGFTVIPASAVSPVDTGGDSGDGGTAGPRMHIAPDAAAYGSHDWYPPNQADVVEEGWLSDLRFVRLELHPYRYRPSDGTLVWNESVRVTVRMADAALAAPADRSARSSVDAAVTVPDSPLADPFDKIIDAVVFNAEQAKPWRTGRGPAVFPPGPPPLSPASVPLISVAVEETGMVRVTGAALRSAGWPIDAIDPFGVALLDGGQEVAVQLDGELDGRFDDADGVTFYGTESTSRYSAQHVYQLVALDRPGRRMGVTMEPPTDMAVADAVTATVRLEENLTYVSDLPHDWAAGEAAFDSTVDRWYGPLLTAPEAVTRTLALPLAAPGDWKGQLYFSAVGKTADVGHRPDHSLSVRIGDSTSGTALGTVRWDGNDRVQNATFDVSNHVLSGHGTDPDIVLEASGDTGAAVDQIYIDRLALTYRREPLATDDRLAFTADGVAGDVPLTGFIGPPTVYNVTDARAPRVVDGVVVQRGALGWGARFRPPTRSARAYEAVAAGGIVGPAAVWLQPAVAPVRAMSGADYVVIAHPDFLGAANRLAAYRRQQAHRTLVVDVTALYAAYSGGMPEPAAIQRFLAEAYAAWDHPPLYVLLVGDGSSDPRGRLVGGARTFIPTYLRVADPWLGEVATDNAFARVSGVDPMPDLAIGRLPVASAAEADALVDKIIAYENDAPNGDWRSKLLFVSDAPDAAGDFYGLSDDIAAHHVPRGYQIAKAYYKQTHPDRTHMRNALLADLDRGALVVQYIGHGRTVSWSADGLLRRTDVAGMANGPRLPIMLDMTCMTGRFSEPLTRSLAEEAVRKTEGGAIAALAPTGFGVATGHEYLNRMFFDALLDLGLQPLGAVVLASKARLFVASTRDRDLLETYALLGDPALNVRLPAVPAAGTPANPAPVGPTPTAAPSTAPPGTAAPPTAQPSPTATPAVRPTDTVSPTPSIAPSDSPAVPTPRRSTLTPTPTSRPPATEPASTQRPVLLPWLSSDA